MAIWVMWISAGIIFIVLEIFTSGFFLALFGLGCIASGITALFTSSFTIQIAAGILTSFLSLLFLRPVAVKYLTRKVQPSNTEALIGKPCQVTTTIHNTQDTGNVKIAGNYWRARSSDNSIIEKGSEVVIEKIEGVTVFVHLKSTNE